MELELDMQDVPTVHAAANHCISRLWNAPSMVAPAFEPSAITVLRHSLKELDEPALRTDVDASINQEAPE